MKDEKHICREYEWKSKTCLREKSDIVRENEDISPLSLNQNSQQCPYITKALWFLLTWAKKLNQYLNFYQSVVFPPLFR